LRVEHETGRVASHAWVIQIDGNAVKIAVAVIPGRYQLVHQGDVVVLALLSPATAAGSLVSMSNAIETGPASPRLLAAVRRTVRLGEVGGAWRPALDRVWHFLRARPGLYADGHNVFLYRHPADRQAALDIWFGVEIANAFDPMEDIVCVETPDGEAVSSVHVGPYAGLRATHEAIHAWAAAAGREFAGWSWEIYGDWTEDESRLETTVAYLLK
jgi:effector-binding domain-containing protein